MNREVTGDTDLQQTSSSSYLVYLFIVSAVFIVVLPYLFPAGSILIRSGKKVDAAGKVSRSTYRKSSASTYTSLPSDAVMKKAYYAESKCEALEDLVIDLQRIVQGEREKILKLESEVRVLQISEGFLKERIQYLEDRNWEFRKDMPASYSSPSIEFMMQNSEGKRESSDVLVQELLRMVQAEKDRTTALEMEVRILQRSEAILVERILKLEEKFAKFLTTCRQTNVFNGEKVQRDSTRN